MIRKFPRSIPFLQNKSYFRFSKLWTEKEISVERNTFPTPRFKADELYYDHDSYEFDEGFPEIVNNLLKNPTIELGNVGLAHVLYNSGLCKVDRPEIYDLCEKESFKYKGQFTQRLAYGGLFGAVASNMARPKLVHFFQNELMPLFNNKEYGGPMSSSQAIQLFYAYSENTILDFEEKKKFVETYILPIVKRNFPRYKFQEKKLFEIFKATMKLEIQDEKFLDTLLKRIVYKKSKGSFRFQISLLEFLSDLSKSYHRELSNEIKFVEENLEKEVDVLWRYNIPERRWYSYSELLAKREDYQFTDQMLGHTNKFQRFRTKLYLETKGKNLKELELMKSSSKMKKEVNKKLEELYEEYIKGKVTYELKDLTSKVDDDDLMEEDDFENDFKFFGSSKKEMEIVNQIPEDKRKEYTKKLIQAYEELDDPEKVRQNTLKYMKEYEDEMENSESE